ncbi:hypothetical protein L7F22_031444 [Adiantum nelumboides]|nr:hypothetical protein [Adiantum nelumboides]
METSSAFLRTLSSPSSILSSPFSDQSHLDFYLHRSSSLPFPSLRSRVSSSIRLLSASPLRALCESACPPPPSVLEPTSEQNCLMEELAELKLQMKQKKKELKLQMKGEKKKLKLQLKYGKKVSKQKDCKDEKRTMMKKFRAESSSSSESSDGESESVNMTMLRQEHILHSSSEALPLTAQREESTICCKGSCADVSSAIVSKIVCAREKNEDVYASVEKMLIFNREAGAVCRESKSEKGFERAISASARCLESSSLLAPVSNRIEVCAGGKCKRAGSEQLLSVLGAQIPSSSDVVAVPCKCMGKCSMGLNVKVHKEDTNPQHHSHVRVEDANIILNHHFGLGCPPSGLPSLPSQDRTRVPSTISV